MTTTADLTFELPEPSVHRTADRGLAAALMALGFELLAVERGHAQVLFLFSTSRMLLDTIDAYLAETLSVSASRMALAFDQLDDLTAGWSPLGEIDLDDL